MKKYYFEADKKLLEKAYQSYECVHTMPARVRVFAPDDGTAALVAAEKLNAIYGGTGILLENIRQVRCMDTPVDWSYGYDDERKAGATSGISDLVGNSQIR